jgi:hypothetical protein
LLCRVGVSRQWGGICSATTKALRVFCKDQAEKTKITLKDLEKGFEIYLKNDDVKKRKEDASIKFALSSMYL